MRRKDSRKHRKEVLNTISPIPGQLIYTLTSRVEKSGKEEHVLLNMNSYIITGIYTDNEGHCTYYAGDKHCLGTDSDIGTSLFTTLLDCISAASNELSKTCFGQNVE